MAKKYYYYDLNVQIWEEGGEFHWSVIQEFDIEGKDVERRAAGITTELDDAISQAREAMQDAL